VFETTDINQGWDGKFNSLEANPGVYLYYLTGEFVNGKSINQKGNFTLIR